MTFRELAAGGLTLGRSPVASSLARLRGELARKKVPLRPFFWVSDEWFCPDGVSGIAVPFYLLHPRLIALEARMVGHAEGELPEEAMAILRHEAGHALDNAFELRRRPDRVALFGPSERRYPSSYAPRPHSRKYVRHLAFHYAQSHPDEDFAETFAVWLTPNSRWRQRYRGWGALEKLRWMDSVLRELRGRAVAPRVGQPYLPLEKLPGTLREHYARKRRHYRIAGNDALGRELAALFPQRGKQSVTALRYFRTIKGRIRRSLASRAPHPLYRIDHVLADLEGRLRSLGLSAPLSRRRLVKRLERLSEKRLRRGFYRIPV
jgi:hypothetical protein